MVVTDNFGVFFDTVDDSRNTPNLRVNPKIVLLIRGMTWGHERTVCSTKVLLTNPAAASSNACRSSYFVRCARTGGNDRRGPA